MNFPPHLPPPSCSVPLQKRLRAVSTILLITAIALLAGFAGGAVLLAVGGNGLSSAGGWLVAARSANNNPPVLASATERDMAERLVMVYARSEIIGSVKTVLPKDKIGAGAIVSSDGWVAVPNADVGKNFKSAAIMLASGKVLPVERGVFDNLANVWYVKVAEPDQASAQSGQFKIMSFADTPAPGDSVFVRNRGIWESATVSALGEQILTGAHSDASAVPTLRILLMALPGSLVILPNGDWAGWVGENNELVPTSAVARVVPGVLLNGAVQHKTLGVEGWFGVEAPIIAAGASQEGFLITKVTAKNSNLRRGDIVTKIEGELAVPDTWNKVLEEVGPLEVTVFRQGKEVELSEPIIIAK